MLPNAVSMAPVETGNPRGGMQLPGTADDRGRLVPVFPLHVCIWALAERLLKQAQRNCRLGLVEDLGILAEIGPMQDPVQQAQVVALGDLWLAAAGVAFAKPV